MRPPPTITRGTPLDGYQSELLRDAGYQTISAPFSIVEFPGASAAFGARSEAVHGARVMAAQLPFVSGWVGSAASLAVVLVLVFPLAQFKPLAYVVYRALTPLALLLRLVTSFVDDVALLACAALGSVGSAVLAPLLGLPGGGGSVFDAGPRLIALVRSAMRVDLRLRALVFALLSFVWTPIKEELLYRHGVQRGVALAAAAAKGRRSRSRAAAAAPSAAAPSTAPSSWRDATDTSDRRLARLVASVAFGLAHLPVSRSVSPLIFALPTAACAGLSSYLCMGALYERRGLPAAVGAHAAHNAGVWALHRLQGRGGWLRAHGASWVAPLIPAAVYANAVVRAGRRRRRRLEEEAIAAGG